MGMDVSTLSTGYVIRTNEGKFVHGTITCNEKESLQQRIMEHANQVSILAHQYDITCAYFENGVIINRATALKIAEVRGACKAACGCIRIVDLPPSQWRKASGADLKKSNREQLKAKALMITNKVIKTTSEDIADAYCILIGGLMIDSMPPIVKKPKKRKKAVDKK